MSRLHSLHSALRLLAVAQAALSEAEKELAGIHPAGVQCHSVRAIVLDFRERLSEQAGQERAVRRFAVEEGA